MTTMNVVEDETVSSLVRSLPSEIEEVRHFMRALGMMCGSGTMEDEVALPILAVVHHVEMLLERIDATTAKLGDLTRLSAHYQLELVR